MKKLVKEMNRNFQRRQIYDQYIYKKKFFNYHHGYANHLTLVRMPYIRENKICQCWSE